MTYLNRGNDSQISLDCCALYFTENGMSLQIADYFQSGSERSEEFAVGLHSEFQPIQGHDIGQFPGLGTEKQAESTLAVQLAT